MTYRVAVVRKNMDGNFVIIFPDEEAYGDTCRAFVPKVDGVHLADLEDHTMGYISRGAYLQATEDVQQEEADRVMKLYSANYCPVKAIYRALLVWKRVS